LGDVLILIAGFLLLPKRHDFPSTTIAPS
jgi:hypothetical protein